MKKVLFLMYSLNIGGAQKVMLKLLQFMDRDRFYPILVLFQRGGRLESELSHDIPIVDLQSRNRMATLSFVIQMAKLLKTESPDFVLSYTWGINLIVLIAGWLVRFKKRIVIVEQNYLSMSILKYSCPRLRKLLIRKFHPKAYKIIACSYGVAKNLMDEFNINPEKISVIYNAVDVEEIQRKKSKSVKNYFNDPSSPYIIGIGRLTSQKNFSLLIRSFSKIVKEISNLNLLILGEGEERPHLERLIEHLNLKGKVFMPGEVDNPYSYLSKAKVFVLSSDYEGYGIVITEAMTCGIPVVATRCPEGPAEIIEDGKSGLLVPPGNESALVEAVLKLFDDKNLSETLAKNAYKRVKDKFSFEQMVKSYEDVLK